ncbi:alpha/beta-hydrolase [Marasmius fiardii PR-910]|nr:alpha/beta-hydrolase [Marasmius fiardii PR-910]
MFALLTSFLLVSTVLAAPAPTPQSSQFLPNSSFNNLGWDDLGKLWCEIPILKRFGNCPRAPGNGLSIPTPIGTAKGTFVSGANRFAVRYASANRWASSTVVTSWQLPNGASDPAAMPLACPQIQLNPPSYSEDCLSMVLYVPTFLDKNSKAPVLVWIHGGSFIAGSASGDGLDGSNLAMSTGAIVAVIQYRLGALGFLGSESNLGAKDVVNALQFLKTNIGPFGGDGSKITLAGQSAGANMIRALLAAPSAQPLFRSAIIQSDPMGYGFLTETVRQDLRNDFLQRIQCGGSDTSCLNSVSLDSITNATWQTHLNGQSINAAAGVGEPIRVVRDGSFITTPLDSTAPFPPVNKPLLISTVRNEATETVYNMFKDPTPNSFFEVVCDQILGTDRTNTLMNSTVYPQNNLSDGSQDSRIALEEVGTDQMWKCPSWTFARNWVQNGGQAFVGVWTRGATYAGNEKIPICLQDGQVCHQDDIKIVFGTVSNPTQAQTDLINEVQTRYKAFLNSGNPNAPGLSQWAQATTNTITPLNLGGVGTISTAACDPSFWGAAVPYDYQIFGL